MNKTAFVLSLAMLSFVMTVIWGPPLLRILRHFRIGKLIRVDEPGHHNVKMGTPTMGGVLFILPVLMLTGLLNAAVFLLVMLHSARWMIGKAFAANGVVKGCVLVRNSCLKFYWLWVLLSF
jgi:UDP-N-acetylmuramyl pentapeptide phosphotransferase/UDP-N-acetylglucosamine-1-phosphate transferase